MALSSPPITQRPAGPDTAGIRERHRQSRVATPATTRPARFGGWRLAFEVALVAVAALLYFVVRGLMHTRVDLAFAHAESIIDIERALGIFHESWLQGQLLGVDWLVTVANRVYIFGHWPVIAATMAWLVWKRPAAFTRYRSALLLSGAIGLVCFVLFPVAPPRFLPEYGFVDTVMEQTSAYRVLQPPSLTNQYAAMPSLHVGWNLLMGIAIVRNTTNRWARGFGYAMPVAMWLATVVTANHYLLDGLVGSVVALIGLALAIAIERWRAARRSAPAPDDTPVRIGESTWARRDAA